MALIGCCPNWVALIGCCPNWVALIGCCPNWVALIGCCPNWVALIGCCPNWVALIGCCPNWMTLIGCCPNWVALIGCCPNWVALIGCCPMQAYSIDELGEHLERRYSVRGCSVWYDTGETVHPAHDKIIISGLTNSPKSKITSKEGTGVAGSVCLNKWAGEVSQWERKHIRVSFKGEGAGGGGGAITPLEW